MRDRFGRFKAYWEREAAKPALIDGPIIGGKYWDTLVVLTFSVLPSMILNVSQLWQGLAISGAMLCAYLVWIRPRIKRFITFPREGSEQPRAIRQSPDGRS